MDWWRLDTYLDSWVSLILIVRGRRPRKSAALRAGQGHGSRFCEGRRIIGSSRWITGCRARHITPPARNTRNYQHREHLSSPSYYIFATCWASSKLSKYGAISNNQSCSHIKHFFAWTHHFNHPWVTRRLPTPDMNIPICSDLLWYAVIFLNAT